MISKRDSIQILDYFGMIGGFHGSLLLLLDFIGIYFSEKFLRYNIAKKLYITKRS